MAILVSTSVGTTPTIQPDTFTLPNAGSIAFWFYPTWAATDNVEHSLFDFRNSPSNNFFTINKFSDNKFYFGWVTSGVSSRIVLNSGGYTLNQNAWNLIVYTWDSGGSSQVALVNNAGGTCASAFTTWNTSGFTCNVGNLDVGTKPAEGRIAELGIWDRVLTTDECTLLNDTRIVPLYLFDSLKTYIPMSTIAAGPATLDYVQKYGTAVGGLNIAIADHAPVVPLVGPRITRKGSTPPPTARFVVGTRVIHPPQPMVLF